MLEALTKITCIKCGHIKTLNVGIDIDDFSMAKISKSGWDIDSINSLEISSLCPNCKYMRAA